MRLKSMIGLKSLMVLAGSMLLFVGACAGETSITSGTSNISVQQAYNLIQDNQGNGDFVVLDIRTLQEYTERYIENAVNIDYYASTFQDDIDGLDKGKAYLVYCSTANRSGQAMPVFENLGFEEVNNMLGGIVAWQAAGYFVVVP